MQNVTLITAIAGLVFGFVGAVLGILNTWRAISRDLVRVRVVPVSLKYEGGTDGFGIVVTNLSYLPVTITSVGFTVRDGSGVDRLTFLPSDIGGCQLPERMEPRTSFTAILPVITGNHPKWSFIHKAYAETACGMRFTGMSGALRQKINHGGRAMP
jgi:hypothetical protein